MRALTLLLIAPTLSLAAFDLPFSCVAVSGQPNGNSGQCSSVAGQLNVNVAQNAPGQATFVVKNNIGILSNVAEVYFDIPTGLLSLIGVSIVNSAGVDFAAGANPPNLPGGNSLSPAFSSDAEFDIGNGQGLNQAADSLTLTFNLGAGKTFANLQDAATNGTFRVGMHIRSIGGSNGTSDAFVSNAPGGQTPVPEPGFTALVIAGMGATFWARRRRDAKLADHPEDRIE